MCVGEGGEGGLRVEKLSFITQKIRRTYITALIKLYRYWFIVAKNIWVGKMAHKVRL